MSGTDADQITAVDQMPNIYRLQIGEKNQRRTDFGCRYEEEQMLNRYRLEIEGKNRCQTNANRRKEPMPNSCEKEEEPMPNDCKEEEPMPNRFRLQIEGRKMQNLITNTYFRGYGGSEGSTEVRRCISGSKGSLDAKDLKVQRVQKLRANA